jgi:transposase
MLNQQHAQRPFRADFQAQMVKLYQQGKSRSELVR